LVPSCLQQLYQLHHLLRGREPVQESSGSNFALEDWAVCPQSGRGKTKLISQKNTSQLAFQGLFVITQVTVSLPDTVLVRGLSRIEQDRGRDMSYGFENVLVMNESMVETTDSEVGKTGLKDMVEITLPDVESDNWEKVSLVQDELGNIVKMKTLLLESHL
jgi:hypothetical protein